MQKNKLLKTGTAVSINPIPPATLPTPPITAITASVSL